MSECQGPRKRAPRSCNSDILLANICDWGRGEQDNDDQEKIDSAIPAWAYRTCGRGARGVLSLFFTARMSTPEDIIGGAVKHLLNNKAEATNNPAFMRQMSETHQYTRKVLLAAKAHVKEDDLQAAEKIKKIDATIAQLDYEFLVFILCFYEECLTSW